MSKSKVVDLYIYPIKACQPVSVKKIELGDSGGARFDRVFCVVDENGSLFPKNEAMSMRNCPPLGGVRVQIRKNKLIISAKSMKRVLEVPIEARAFEDEKSMCISCSGLSTTSEGGWSLGHVDARYCGLDAENWFTEYLTNKLIDKIKRKNAKGVRFALARSFGRGRACSNYAGPMQVPFSDDVKAQRLGKASPFKMTNVPVLENDRVHFQDSFPFLVTSVDSLKALRVAMNEKDYPMSAFRPNIVVSTGGKEFEEERWSVFRFSSGVIFRQLKLCPRCTVPTRDPTSGEFLLKDNKLLFMKTLRKMFPKKTKDSEWGEEWEGATFGVLSAHNGSKGEIRVGDSVEALVYMHRPNAHGDGSFGGDGGNAMCNVS